VTIFTVFKVLRVQRSEKGRRKKIGVGKGKNKEFNLLSNLTRNFDEDPIWKQTKPWRDSEQLLSGVHLNLFSKLEWKSRL
jgi:hypothetical protein